MAEQAIIFDGDDTLWMTQPIYKSVMDEFYDILEQEGFRPTEFRSIFASINQDLLKKIKLSRDRLTLAMVGTYEAMCQRKAISIQSSINQNLTQLAEQVYVRAPEPMEHVYEVLSRLQKEFKLVFYSGGVEETQKTRLAKLELDQYFQDHVFVVTKKDVETLEDIVQECGLNVEKTWLIGNSPKFDINPALQIGLNCVWMHTSFWKQELEDIYIKRIFVAFSLDQVANILLYGSGFGTEEYIPPARQVQEIQTALSKFSTSYPQDAWVIGTSPKLDINPALSLGANAIWIPTAFDGEDVEAFGGKLFVAFSPDSAERIVTYWSNGDSNSVKLIWQLRKNSGDLGGSLIVD